MPELSLQGKTLEEAKSSSINEALRLLAVAESLEKQAEQRDADVVRYSFTILGIVAVMTIVVPILLTLQNANLLSQGLTLAIAALAGVQAAWGIQYCWRLRAKAVQARDVDQQLMQRIIDFLREIEGAFALDDQVSILDRIGIQTRLSRYGIGPGERGKGTSSPPT